MRRSRAENAGRAVRARAVPKRRGPSRSWDQLQRAGGGWDRRAFWGRRTKASQGYDLFLNRLTKSRLLLLAPWILVLWQRSSSPLLRLILLYSKPGRGGSVKTIWARPATFSRCADQDTDCANI